MTAQNLSTYVATLEEEAHRRAVELEALRVRGVEVEATQKRKSEVSVQRWVTLGFVLCGLLLVTLILGICAWIYFSTGRDSGKDPDIQREKDCLVNGGGFVPRDMLDGSADDRGLCVYPGKRAES